MYLPHLPIHRDPDYWWVTHHAVFTCVLVRAWSSTAGWYICTSGFVV